MTSWYGVVTQKGVPNAIIEKIQKDIAESLNTPKMQNTLSTFGLMPVASTPEDFARKIALDTKNWGEIIKKANIQPVQ